MMLRACGVAVVTAVLAGGAWAAESGGAGHKGATASVTASAATTARRGVEIEVMRADEVRVEGSIKDRGPGAGPKRRYTVELLRGLAGLDTKAAPAASRPVGPGPGTFRFDMAGSPFRAGDAYT